MATSTSITVPILCEFWYEDGVWNGVAKNLPIAVFGDTFETASEHMRNAVTAFFQSVAKHGETDNIIAELRKSESTSIPVSEFTASRPLVKYSVELRDQGQVVGVV